MVDGQPPFSDQSLVELARGERELVTRDTGAAIVGSNDVELVVDPDERRRGEGTRLLTQVLDEHPEVQYAWAHGDHPGSRALAARFGFEPVRTLLQLRAPVGDAANDRATPEDQSGNGGMRVVSFRPGTDDADWLALNARAFAHHPEQGGLGQRDLDDRKAEDWFDPDDFLILRDGDTMIGFCWLKIEPADGHDRVGEFYAVGIDPDRQGEGLGRVLMAAGLARLAAQSIHTAALYVEADNLPALALYDRYGFARHTIDVHYRATGLFTVR
ncbi:MAG: mycothiol synthase [Parvibaculum sp.]|nr:mycothiol synthase [Parvibaculum sp.]